MLLLLYRSRLQEKEAILVNEQQVSERKMFEEKGMQWERKMYEEKAMQWERKMLEEMVNAMGLSR